MDGITHLSAGQPAKHEAQLDRKSTRLNSSHGYISYAVFCLKKKKKHHWSPASGKSPESRPPPAASSSRPAGSGAATRERTSEAYRTAGEAPHRQKSTTPLRL